MYYFHFQKNKTHIYQKQNNYICLVFLSVFVIINRSSFYISHSGLLLVTTRSGGSEPERIFLPELVEEPTELDDTLDWHGVVHRNTNAWVLRVTSNIDDFVSCCFLDELLLQRPIPFNSEVNIHLTTEFMVGSVDVIPIRLVQKIIKHFTFHFCHSLVILNSTHLVHVADIKGSQIDTPHWWGVVVGAGRFLEGCPVVEDWHILFSFAKKTFVHDNDGGPSWTKVLLDTCVNNIIPFPIDFSRADIRTHVSDNHHVLRERVPREVVLSNLEPVHCFVDANMKVGSFAINFPGTWIR